MTTREPDDDLEIRLSRALDASDPIPEHVLEAARAAIGWRTIDAELAELLHEDSKELAGVRGGDAGPRHLTFAAGDVELELMLAVAARRIRVAVRPDAGAALVTPWLAL